MFLNLSLVIHNHQPVGNFDFVFAAATERAYDPILGLLERHPGVRLSLHYTGPLWDWLLKRRPDHVERLKALVARGQVELLTGAYYEPILVAIPDADKVGQIRKMTDFLRQTFGVEPTGMWLGGGGRGGSGRPPPPSPSPRRESATPCWTIPPSRWPASPTTISSAPTSPRNRDTRSQSSAT